MRGYIFWCYQFFYGCHSTSLMAIMINQAQMKNGQKIRRNLLRACLGDLGDALIDETIKRYGGLSIISMKVVERGADFVIADVTYSGADASGLKLSGYATLKKRKIVGISFQAVPLTNPSGTVQIRIARSKEGTPEIETDSVFLMISKKGDQPEAATKHSFELKKIWSQLDWLDELGPRELIFAGGPLTIDVIQKTSSSKPKPKPKPSALKPTLQATRLKKTYSHRAVSTFKYTATTRNRAKKQGRVHAGNLVWNCRSKSCTISGPWPTPGLSACNRLARIVGWITSYGHPKRRLSASQLAQCNRGAAN